MNSQLRWISDLLEQHHIPYWVDSGTLLGLVRDGDVMDHDKDIDLSIWSEHCDRVRALSNNFEEAGYSVNEGVYEGLPYNFLLKPKEVDGITISIGVNRRRRNKVWRIATFVKDNPHPRWGMMFFIRGAWRFPLRQAAWLITRWVPRSALVKTWPFSLVIGSGVWIIPYEYVERTIPHEPTGLPIPIKWDAYLTKRYGNWRKPVKDWEWYRDDGAAHVGDPQHLVKRATNEHVESKR